MLKAQRKGKLLDGIVGDGIDCYVLNDEQATPVIHVRGMTKAIGATEKGSLERSLTRIGLEALYKSAPPMPVSLPGGGVALCYPATFLIDVCGAIDQRADQNPPLRADQAHMVVAARGINRAFAKFGIERAVYDATGFDPALAQHMATARLALALRDDMRPWDQMFDKDFFRSLARLYGHGNDEGKPIAWMASVIEMLYRMVLGEEILDEMQNRNPEPHHGSNHHQMLTDGARAFFRQNMVAIKMLMHLSRSREDFKAKLRSEYLGHPLQLGW